MSSPTRERPVTWMSCSTCGDVFPETDPAVRCDCGSLLDVHHRPPDKPGQELRAMFRRNDPDPTRVPPATSDQRPATSPSGVWSFRDLVLPGVSEDQIVSHPEGNTPLIERPVLAGWAGLGRLVLKHEGHNPTGSFKDRGMTVGVTQAGRVGARAVACASTGNTSASLAAYAAQAGLPALVLVPAGRVAEGKLAQALAHGARVLAVRGDFDTCLRLLDEAATRLGVYLLNSVNPFRIEGQKTIVLELLAQLDWTPPDWIVFPAGNLGNTAAFGKALIEAREWGLIDRLPRLAAVQAEGAAPFAAGFREGFSRRHRVEARTVATAIRIGDPASWDRAVIAIRATEGVVVSVPDPEILEAKGAIDRCGVGCEAASAASLAGLRRLVAAGTIAPTAKVVAILTGHLLKEPGAPTGEIPEIEATGAAVDRAIQRAMRSTASPSST